MRRSAVVALAIAFSISVAGCGSDTDGVGRAAPDTIHDGKLVACTDMPYEPFEFVDGGQEKGIDVDLVKAMAADWGLTAEFRDTDFDSIFDELTSRNCDLVASAVSITSERQEQYLFSDGYFEVNQSLMVRVGDVSRYGQLDALAGKRVGVQKGTTGADYAASHANKSTIVEFDDASDMVSALQNAEIDGVVQDFPINSYLAQKQPNVKVVKTFTDVAREQYGFAMSKDSAALRDAVNSALTEIRKDGRYDRILNSYLGSAVK